MLAAVRGQNVQFAAGKIGADPAPAGQAFTATVSAEGRFSTPEQFGNIILRTNTDGTTRAPARCRPHRDWARRPTASTAAGTASPAAGFAVQLAPGANALGVADAVCERMDELQSTFPQGVTWFSPYDSSTFVAVSIKEVIKTLFEAIVLVFLVMLIFLQNFRATLIPTLVIPIALLGTFLGMYFIGFTINQLSLFGMVLAIGIVVDDAIVVIENVERIMTEEGPVAEGGHAQVDEPDQRRGRGDHRGAGGGVHPQRVPGRQRRRDLQAVRHHHRHGDVLLGIPGAGLHPGAVRDAAQADRRPPPRQLHLPQLQQALRQGQSAPTSATSAARSSTRRAG